MSLFGSNSRYTTGALENAKLIDKIFPGWTLRIYLPKLSTLKPSQKDKIVPKYIVEKLKMLKVELIFIDLETTLIKNPCLWRFLVARDISVDRFLIRDIDSRLISRDATEVAIWIKSGKPFHCMIDHPGHLSWPVLAGMWGAIPLKLQKYLSNDTFTARTMSKYYQNYGDQAFLRDIIWPRVKDHAYCSDSFTCAVHQSSHPFQSKRSKNLEFVGEVILGDGSRRKEDLNMIKANPVNPNCSPS